ncbi:DUF4180 domain-containing protein [Paracoccus aminophilus]|uniref:Alpha/beta hydrolase n=1 Tax=Paracoccus aminophilus JCM 7686 TaxID=1367847 RepID=S5XTU1_PARAH|nr:DUF4180 domain-containing protein [Paracoccus aminophilus]AGT10934.1 alpha/beta hydrolase [Paracoccus aminophilus JCM 7686]
MPQIIDTATRKLLVLEETGPALEKPSDANDILSLASAAGADFVAIPASRLGPDFLRLETRLAGEVFQKFVNYRLGCAILGDLSAALAASKALRDFVGETNKTANKDGAIWFAQDLDALLARLA